MAITQPNIRRVRRCKRRVRHDLTVSPSMTASDGVRDGLEKLLEESRLEILALKTLNKTQHTVIENLLPKKPSGPPPGIIDNILLEVIQEQREKEKKAYIWADCYWSDLSKLENNNRGIVGEQFIQRICDRTGITAKINGVGSKQKGGGIGDGTIKDRSVEIKCARAGSGKSISYQHELAEKPWVAEYILFLDIHPKKYYITIMPNFTEKQWRAHEKASPYFPTRSLGQRKKTGAFKFDTTEKLNNEKSLLLEGNTLCCKSGTTIEEVSSFINRIIHD